MVNVSLTRNEIKILLDALWGASAESAAFELKDPELVKYFKDAVILQNKLKKLQKTGVQKENKTITLIQQPRGYGKSYSNLKTDVSKTLLITLDLLVKKYKKHFTKRLILEEAIKLLKVELEYENRKL